MATPPPVLDVSFGPLYDSPDNGGLTPAEIERLADEDIERFNVYFRDVLKNEESLAPSERAIIKTYLYFKTLASAQGDAR